MSNGNYAVLPLGVGAAILQMERNFYNFLALCISQFQMLPSPRATPGHLTKIFAWGAGNLT